VLIKYNKEDVVNLKTIIEMTYQKMVDNEIAPKERKRTNSFSNETECCLK